MTALMRCTWCGKDRRKPSQWEQEGVRDGWERLCVRCANKRLDNPFNALLKMRKIAADAAP